MKFALKVTPFQTAQFRQISAHSTSTMKAVDRFYLTVPQPWQLARKVQLALIGNRPCTFQQTIDEQMYVTSKSTKGWHKTQFCCFPPIKIQLLVKKSATQFPCVKTYSDKVVATLFLYLTIHRRIACNIPIYQKVALKVTHLSRKRRSMRANETSSIIANKKSTMRFSSSHRWTVCVNPTSMKEWLQTRIFTSGVGFHFFVAGNCRHFKSAMWVEHSKSQPRDDKLSLKWAWSRHVTWSNFKFLVFLKS